MTITQTVEIPADHRLTIDVPLEIPAGPAKIELIFTPLAADPQEANRTKIHLTKPMVNELLRNEVLRSLTGFLHTEMSIGEIRAERLKKHDHTH